MKTTQFNSPDLRMAFQQAKFLTASAFYSALFAPVLIAQVQFVNIYSFSAGVSSPSTGLVQGADGRLYGASVTPAGMPASIFKIGLGGAFSNLYSFSSADNLEGYVADGLFQANDGDFYATTAGGASGQYGAIFRFTPAGAVTVLHRFSGSDGGGPTSGLIQASNGNFYGSNVFVDPVGDGNIFRFGRGGLTVLYTFLPPTGVVYRPEGGTRLVQGRDGNLYGTTNSGGQSSQGSIFRMTLSGQLTTLYEFSALSNSPSALIQGGDGNFYGTIPTGGVFTGTNGAVFEITPEGSFQFVFQFNPVYEGTTIGQPSGLMQASDGNFYGYARVDPYFVTPAIFQLTPQGVMTPIYTFQDGGVPQGPLLQASNGHIYGAMVGGTNGAGYLFGLALGLPLPKPHLRNFTPVSGKPGQVVAITGGNLVGTTAVKFNGVIAGFKIVSPVVGYTVVPNGATTGTISLTTAAGTVTSTKSFTVLP